MSCPTIAPQPLLTSTAHVVDARALLGKPGGLRVTSPDPTPMLGTTMYAADNKARNNMNRLVVVCGVCRERFASYGKLNEHFKRDHGIDWEVGQEKAASPAANDEEEEEISSEEEDEEDEEDSEGEPITGRKKRKLENNQDHQCEDCSKIFASRGKLASHVLAHTGEKPFECEQCGQCFNQKGTLTIHARVHTGEKPYQCKECNRAYTSRASLTRHSRTHTGGKPYQCHKCGKRFVRLNDLLLHPPHCKHQPSSPITTT
ncbi:hypothetical protein BASA81_010999 [Batrachochytrium salamandrivorans]|nr:hypothetical protein BASA81_010999 [Batrachochytrium salamandrivorans]